MGGSIKTMARKTALFGRFWRKSSILSAGGRELSGKRPIRRKELMELCKKDLQQACHEHEDKLMQIGEVRLRSRIRTAITS
ncbi:hypothetical protein [Actibacterium pelagium]|uniref:Uncharacterized protein n=1 Tax=Actibacterium pelagium TaxID=2029103 RepID=A0A917EJ81_9RHOB|nr:hypothetical protein [Actibacterium pelagium]GGE43440.1 hypothetical protein GCM10011517_08860 [Actibacterium pelagium]